MKFSIITPVYNGGKYIAETIESILSQEGDFEIEYIIQDGQSTDNTLSIIKSYDEKLRTGVFPIKCNGISFRWYSEKDEGMFDAVNKGFGKATGDVYAWMNSDDLYLPKAFSFVARSFAEHPDISWLKGSGFLIDESSNVYGKVPSYLYNQEWIARGLYGTVAPFIPLETVFWRNNLWHKSGGIDTTLRLVGDYYLWLQFAKYAPLWSINTDVSCFRTSSTQLSHDMEPYREEQQKILPRRDSLYYVVGIFFLIRAKTKRYPSLSTVLYKMIFRNRNKKIIDVSPDESLVIRTVDSFVM